MTFIAAIRSAPGSRAEQNELMAVFLEILELPTQDGGRKRAAGQKVLWKIDTGHYAALYRHLERLEQGELYDEDSGAPAWAHIAWRACALAYQQMYADGRLIEPSEHMGD